MIDNNLKKYKSLYLLVSGGTDSALGLFLITKYINDNKLDTKITVSTAVEPQPHYCRNDKNAKKIVSIIKDMFPDININHKINFLEGYQRRKPGDPKTYPKVKAMGELIQNEKKDGLYDLFISFLTSLPKDEHLKENKRLYEKHIDIGPEDRKWTGLRNDKISGNWYNPFLNLHKKDLADLYEKYDLMDNLFTYTASCTGVAKVTDNFTKPCQDCFWCVEKFWAFYMYDLPQAYRL